MQFQRICAITLLAALPVSPIFGRKKKQPAAAPKAPVIEQMSPDERIVHALNRLAFGPRPGDVERVRSMGVDGWIEEQLHPSTIPENSELQERLQPLETLRMTSAETVAKYPPNNLFKAMVTGKAPWPEDSDQRIVLQRIADRRHEKFGVPGNDPPTFGQVLQELPAAQRQIVESGRPIEKVALLESLPVAEQYDVVTALPPGQRQKVFALASPSLRRRMESFEGPERVVNNDLAAGKIFRAVYSDRQLEEVLTDFWYNHFNVFLDKGADRYLVTSYERDAIRPFVLGKFKDLLAATAQSPAMLFYLDNFQSARDGFESKNPNAKRAKRGLNENYGRELMELHTLGVDGGYTQQDVTEVARCFTGWTIADPQHGGNFMFRENMHDNGAKTVLGVTIPAGGGFDDGYKVIDILARQPATARFISRALAVRFVSDNPPPALVDRMAATFLSQDGDLRAVMETMVHSPEFWAKAAYRAKIKSPFEMVISALRATDSNVDFTNGVINQMNQLGEPLYRKVEPTGYSNSSSEWMNSASLLGRLNFAVNLTANRVAGVKLSLPATVDPDAMAQTLIQAPLTGESRQIVEKGLSHPESVTSPVVNSGATPSPGIKPVQFQSPAPAFVAGLILGSPDFQRR